MDFIYTNCIEHFQQYITLCNDISKQHMYNQYRVHLSISLNNLISTNNQKYIEYNATEYKHQQVKSFEIFYHHEHDNHFINIYLLVNLISHTGVNKTGKQHITHLWTD